MPVSRTGVTTLPALPFTSEVTVSVICTVTLPVKKVKLIVSLYSKAMYSVIWKIDFPTYSPNGMMDGVSCMPRIAVPTKAASAPEV